jgi:hypothetical protein
MTGTIDISNSEFISDIDLGWNSGGNILLDVITLKDGTLLFIGEGGIALYKDWDAYDEVETLGEINRPVE